LGGRRLRNRVSTEREIRDAAFALFAANGFEATTIDDIAIAADVGRRTVFRYYPNKEAIAFGGTERRLQRLREVLAEHHIEGEPPFVSIGRALVVFLEELEEDPDVLAGARLVEANPVLLRRSREIGADWERVLYRELRRRFAGGSDCPDFLFMQVFSGVGVAIVFATLRTWYLEGQQTPLAAVFLKAYERMYDAIVPHPPDVARDRATTDLERRAVVQSSITSRMAELGLADPAALASKSGLNVATIERLLAGRSRPHNSTLVNIATALEWPPQALADVVVRLPGPSLNAETAIQADPRLSRENKEKLLELMAALLGEDQLEARG
jgi:AcrR family transcriptional regulator